MPLAVFLFFRPWTSSREKASQLRIKTATQAWKKRKPGPKEQKCLRCLTHFQPSLTLRRPPAFFVKALLSFSHGAVSTTSLALRKKSGLPPYFFMVTTWFFYLAAGLVVCSPSTSLLYRFPGFLPAPLFLRCPSQTSSISFYKAYEPNLDDNPEAIQAKLLSLWEVAALKRPSFN